jgi:lipoate---protein ligase
MLRNPLQKQSNWHIYPLIVADQQQHIETSEQLLNSIQPGDPGILYWSLAERTGLVLGFSQKPDVLNQDELATQALPIYHRRAGGTAVLVGRHLLSLDVIRPAGHPLMLADIVESYRWFGATWVAALRRLDVQTRLVPPAEAHAQQALRKSPETRDYELLMNRSCYGTLSPYEVAVEQRKLVGLDMIRRRTGSLLQAGLLLHWDTDILAHLLGHTEEEQETLRLGLLQRAVGLDTLMGRSVAVEEVITVFQKSLKAKEWIRT